MIEEKTTTRVVLDLSVDEFEFLKEIGGEADVRIPVEKVISIFIHDVMQGTEDLIDELECEEIEAFMKKHANY